MSITNALYSSFYGLKNTEQRIAVTSQNVTNADQEGYTRKEIQSDLYTSNAGTVPVNGSIATVDYNEFLLEGMIDDSSTANMQSIIAEYMSYYTNELGSTDGNNSLSAYVDSFSAGLSQLAQTPEDASLKSQVVSDAQRIANELNRISNSIQDYRLKVDQEIENAVLQVNEITDFIEQLNDQITERDALGYSVADLVDQRNYQLEKLSQYVDFDYFTNVNNYTQIYTGGRPLLNSMASSIEYTANTALDKNTTYPAGFNSIDLNGFDLTSTLQGGELAGLISIRDDYMVEEQAKMDEFASVLIDQMNTLFNQGQSSPARSTITGDLEGLTGATAFSGGGPLSIITVDVNGTVTSRDLIATFGLTTISDILNAINAAGTVDVTASLTTDGALEITADNSGDFIVFGDLFGGTSVSPDNDTFIKYFGLNNLYTGTGADDIDVSDYLINSPEYLPTSYIITDNSLLPIGTSIVFAGDSELIKDAVTTLQSSVSFNAAGNFGAQTESLDNYIDLIISNAAYRTSNAETDASISLSLMEQTQTTLQNLSGVNIDEEMTHLIDLEAKYEASATMIAALQEMFDTLINAVR